MIKTEKEAIRILIKTMDFNWNLIEYYEKEYQPE
jgi:hypothetical protein